MKSKVVGTGADQGTRSRWANNFLPQTKHKANKSLKIEAKLNFNSVEPFFYQKLMETIQNVSQYNCIKSLFLYFVEDIMKRKFYVISMTEHWKKLEDLPTNWDYCDWIIASTQVWIALRLECSTQTGNILHVCLLSKKSLLKIIQLHLVVSLLRAKESTLAISFWLNVR